jgi:tyrosyl-tRNA synthetase
VSGCYEDLEFRGLVHQMSDAGLAARLDGEAVTAYSGFDPTADSLHVGHLLGLSNLRRLQEHGHRPIVLLGGATAMIGDPGGKGEERPLLDRQTVEANTAAIRLQLEGILDFGQGRSRALVVDNADWLPATGLLDFLRDAGKHFTVNQMIAKESVRARLETPERGISFTEFSYMLLQASDFRHLYDSHGCRLQMGGSEQWGNITMGIDLVHRTRGAQVWGMTWPLVLRPDGTKFGKTEQGTVWLDSSRTSSYGLYQHFVRTEDAVVGEMLRFYTWLDRDRILELDEAVKKRPDIREAQRELAFRVTALVHGEPEARRAEQASIALFAEDVAALDEATLLEVFAEAPAITLSRSGLDDGGLTLLDVMVESALVPSRSAGRRAVDQGGAYVNNRRQSDPERRLRTADLLHGRYLLVRRGRKEHQLVRFE